MDRLFLDANILVSAALKPESRLAGLWMLAEVRLLASPHVVAEARRNVREPEAASRLAALLGAVAVLPSEPAEFEIAGCPPLLEKDRPVLLGAIVANADYLLTGDMTHFRECFGKRLGGVLVVLPREYLRQRAGP